MEKGVKRWLVDISQWEPSPDEFTSAVSVLPQHEHSSIWRFIKLEDKKRALVSRLLQYALVHEVLQIPFDAIIIKRTVEGKPYLETSKVVTEIPNFNFNASHHGDYVAIASEPLCIVGLDIVSYVVPEKETIAGFMQNFAIYFSSFEWASITNAGTSDEMLSAFYRYWSLKEAFVKAVGTGLGYRLDKVEFHHTNWTNISVKIDGLESREWKFWLSELKNVHWVTVARGHPSYATESYKRMLKRTEYEEEEFRFGLQLPNVDFVLKTVEQLILLARSRKKTSATTNKNIYEV